MNEAEKSLDLGMMCVFEQKLWLHRFGFVACKLAFDAPSALLCFFKPLCNDDKCNEYTVLAWKSPKKSHFTLRAKRAKYTSWVDKSSLKMPKKVNFGEFF